MTPTSRSANRTSPGSPSGPSQARVWWLAARPPTLAVAVSAVLAGTAVAAHDGAVRALPGLGALVVAIAIQVGTNYANDYSDFVRGTDSRRVGPLRAASSGLVDPEHVKWAAVAAFGVAAVVGLAVSLATSWVLVGLGALAFAAGWLYTGGPRPYGYIGLGEVFVFVFFGLLATAGTTYVHELRVPAAAWAAGCATGFLACAILAVNNLRDIDTDAAAGKRTLTVRIGRRGTRLLVAGLLVASLLVPVVAAALRWVPVWALLPLLIAPWVLRVVRATGSTEPPVLIGALKGLAVLEVWWALLWTLGLLL